MQVGVTGAGSWGSALAILFATKFEIVIYSRDYDQVDTLNRLHINPKALPESIKFNQKIIASNNFADLAKADLLLIATPISALREILQKIKQTFIDQALPDLIWVCKGFEVESGLLPHQVVNEVLDHPQNTGALLGPSFALEVANNLPTAITLASHNKEFINKWLEHFVGLDNFRVYGNLDLIGCEVATGMKNVIAIASGISDGLKLGYNARAALITRSLSELGLLVKALGGRVETIYGLTGVGDLILTCTGELSRNRKVGLALANGDKLEQILQNMGHVAEGVYATKALHSIAAKLNLDMPITKAVYQILYEGVDLPKAINQLFLRSPKHEI